MTKLAILSIQGKAFEVHHEVPILGVELQSHTKFITNVQFPSISLVSHQGCVLDDSVNFYKLLN